MLVCVYGLDGTGKSLFSISDYLLYYVKQEKDVYTNITGIDPVAVSGLLNLSPLAARIHEISSLAEVLDVFDDPELGRNCLFLIDEVQEWLGDEKEVEWLDNRLAVMRKHNIDFVFITQIPSRIPPAIRKRSRACVFFERQYELGSEDGVWEYRWNKGTPEFEEGKPVNYKAKLSRKLDKSIYKCYQSYIDQQIMGAPEVKTALKHTTRLWASSKAKRLYISLGIPIVICSLLLYCLFHITDTITGNVPQASKVGRPVPKAAFSEQGGGGSSSSVETSCFRRLSCDEYVCTTDAGTYSANHYDRRNDWILDGGKIIRRCDSFAPIAEDKGKK